MHLNEIIGKFEGVKQIGNNSFQCLCPSHLDSKQSLTITEEDNKILMHCFAGCDNKDILSKIGLSEKDLFNNEKTVSKVVAEYIYRDENNKPLFKVMRFEPKNFVQAKYNNGNWEFKMSNARYVPYNLPNVMKANEVYFVEGEKDANNLNSIGLVATTTASGASGFKKKASEYAEYFRNKIVYVIPDNDKPGYTYAENIKDALNGIVSQVKILKLTNEVKDLKEKEDISDVLKKYGKDKTIEILNNLKQDIINDVENDFSKDTVFSGELFEKLYEFEMQDMEKFIELYGKVKTLCIAKRITGFDRMYKLFKESKKPKEVFSPCVLNFKGLNDEIYESNRYELNEDGFILENIPNIGKTLVCYHPILPFERYINLETGQEKIKLAYYKSEEWKFIIVDKSVISSSQSIVKLSDFGISVTSENARYLIKYLTEIENLNKDKIKTSISISRLGWFKGNVLIPYSDIYEFDNEKDMPHLKEMFGESGKLETWIEFFKERRKYNNISRIIMAAGVASILLKRIKQNGFTVHVWRRKRISEKLLLVW